MGAGVVGDVERSLYVEHGKGQSCGFDPDGCSFSNLVGFTKLNSGRHGSRFSHVSVSARIDLDRRSWVSNPGQCYGSEPLGQMPARGIPPTGAIERQRFEEHYD